MTKLDKSVDDFHQNNSMSSIIRRFILFGKIKKILNIIKLGDEVRQMNIITMNENTFLDVKCKFQAYYKILKHNKSCNHYSL